MNQFPNVRQHFPTSQDRAAEISELSDQDLFNIVWGKSFVAEDPHKHTIRVVEKSSATEVDKKQMLDIRDDLLRVIEEQRPEFIERTADAARMGLQTEPEMLERARNRVRKNFELAPVVDATMVKKLEPMVGKVTNQNGSQSIFTHTTAQETKGYLIDHSDLPGGLAPKRDVSLRLERSANADSKFVLSPIVPIAKPGVSLKH